jgi:hypothetical protein
VSAVDYAFPPHPGPAALRAAGVTGVLRYLAWQTVSAAPKTIQPEEFRALIAAGIDVTLNWEYGADDFTRRSFDSTGAAGEAVRQARALGYPDECAIYYSVDQDITGSQWPVVRDHFRAINAVHGLARTGIYGPWDALEWARQDRVASWFWQAGMSTAWSAGRNRNLWPGAHLRQRRQQTIDGADCDVNDIIQADYGQYGRDSMTATESAHNASANSWAVRMGVSTTVYANDAPGTPVSVGNPLWDLLRRVDASVAADLAEDKAATVAVAALTDTLSHLVTAGGGGNLDTATVLAALTEVKTAVAEARSAESAAITELHGQLAALTDQLTAAQNELHQLRSQLAKAARDSAADLA